MEHFIFKPSFILTAIRGILPFLPLTLAIAGASFGFGIAFGALLAAAKLSGRRIPAALARGYTSIMRTTPSVVLLFVVFYGLPVLWESVLHTSIQSAPRVFYAIFSLSALFAATSSELLRSAYEAIDKGQREAALMVGLTPASAFVRILAPQIGRLIVPNLALSYVTLLKEASLGFTIGVIDMMGRARLIISNNYNAYGLETYIGLALIYWVLSFTVSFFAKYYEKRVHIGKAMGA